MDRKAFTLIETLLALSITLMILLNASAIIHVSNVSYMQYDEDISIGVKQLSTYLMTSQNITFDDQLEYDYSDHKHYTISINNHRLVKEPGFEILMMNIDSIKYISRNDYLYAVIKRDNHSYQFLLTDLYRLDTKSSDESEKPENEETS
ncbi:MAG: hypothetical protein J6P61_08365 [Erysipelotrichaceae bacterium]|nr:hypothetical protein [Erysipelotrichaceae bacterium]